MSNSSKREGKEKTERHLRLIKTVRGSGGGVAVPVPIDWLRRMDCLPGSEVVLTLRNERHLTVVKNKKEGEKL